MKETEFAVSGIISLVRVDDQTLAALSNNGNVTTIDITDPTAPSQLDVRASAVAFESRLFFHDGKVFWNDDTFLRYCDVSDPSNIGAVSSLNITNDSSYASQHGNFLFLPCTGDLLKVVELNGPTVVSDTSTAVTLPRFVTGSYGDVVWVTSTSANATEVYEVINEPPATPTIVSPTELAVLESPVSLQITYSDPEGEPQSKVSFRREVV